MTVPSLKLSLPLISVTHKPWVFLFLFGLCILHLAFVLGLSLFCFFRDCSHLLLSLQSQNARGCPQIPLSGTVFLLSARTIRSIVQRVVSQARPTSALHYLVPLLHSVLLLGSQTVICPADAPFSLAHAPSVLVSCCCCTKFPVT